MEAISKMGLIELCATIIRADGTIEELGVIASNKNQENTEQEKENE